jgi:hypothetical protein
MLKLESSSRHWKFDIQRNHNLGNTCTSHETLYCNPALFDADTRQQSGVTPISSGWLVDDEQTNKIPKKAHQLVSIGSKDVDPACEPGLTSLGMSLLRRDRHWFDVAVLFYLENEYWH